jgi:hypothetical protein
VKNYSSNRAQKGKTAYRTPSMFKANKAVSSNKYRVYSKSIQQKVNFEQLRQE